MKKLRMKPVEELTLLDRFLFDQCVSDPEICKIILEIALGREISDLKITSSEKTLELYANARSIRLDLLAFDTDSIVYDTEMQARDTKNLPKRSRYYNGFMDVSLMDIGDTDFNHLNDSYVIFICPFDIFNLGKYRYTFVMQCQEDKDLYLGDGQTRIFLNTEGCNDSEVSPELVEFLKYVKQSACQLAPEQIQSPKIKKMDAYIRKMKENEEFGVKYMQAWEEKIYIRKEGFDEGLEEGLTEGIKAFIELSCELGTSQEVIIGKLCDKFKISEDKAWEYIHRFWK